MKIVKFCCNILIVLLVFTSCSTPINLSQGTVTSSPFYSKIKFSTVKSLILVPCKLNGVTKNFIFDTGATVTVVNRDSIFGSEVEVRGASNRTVINGSEIIKSMMIGNIDFANTFATNANMSELKDQILNFGGILGRSIINKANWLIDYPNKTLEISNRDLSNSLFTDIELEHSTEKPNTFVEIDKKKYRTIIDLGSVSTFNVPAETKLANHLLKTYNFTEKNRERYTIGGTQIITELIGTIPILKLGDLEFTDVEVNINQSSQRRIGMNFFKAYSIYIDNDNNKYKLFKSENIP